jgi:hypothetical protein
VLLPVGISEGCTLTKEPESNMELKTLVIVGLAVVLILFIAGTILRAMSKGSKKEPEDALETHVMKECASCGWKGKVSKYHKRCSGCGEELF